MSKQISDHYSKKNDNSVDAFKLLKSKGILCLNFCGLK